MHRLFNPKITPSKISPLRAYLVGVLGVTLLLNPLLVAWAENTPSLPPMSGTSAPNVAFDEKVQAIQSAQAAMQQNDWETANYQWRRVLTLDPTNLEATVGLAQSLFFSGFNREAVTLLDSISPEKRTVAVDMGLARVHAALKEYDQSEAAYIRVLKQRPFEVSLMQELADEKNFLSVPLQKEVDTLFSALAKQAKPKAEAALVQGKYDEAAKFYSILAFQEHTIGLVNDYGLILLLAGQYQAAANQFALLQKKGKLRFSEVASNAAITELSMGHYAEAKKKILEAINASGEDNLLKAKLYNNMGYILEMSRHRQDAKFAYQHALTLDPNFLMAQLNLAFVQQADRNYPDAIEQYRDILKKDPNNVKLWNRMGFAYELSYKSAPAITAYRRAIQIDPTYADSYYNLAILYKKMGKIKEGIAVMKQFAEVGYSQIEGRPVKTEQIEETAESEDKNPLKYVSLFPSNPNVLGH